MVAIQDVSAEDGQCWTGTYLVVNALIEGDTQRPPIDLEIVTATFIHLRSEIS